jgi:hypothetical protein
MASLRDETFKRDPLRTTAGNTDLCPLKGTPRYRDTDEPGFGGDHQPSLRRKGHLHRHGCSIKPGGFQRLVWYLPSHVQKRLCTLASLAENRLQPRMQLRSAMPYEIDGCAPLFMALGSHDLPSCSRLTDIEKLGGDLYQDLSTAVYLVHRKCMHVHDSDESGHWRKKFLQRRHLGISEHADTKFGPAVMKCATDGKHVPKTTSKFLTWTAFHIEPPNGLRASPSITLKLTRFRYPRKCTCTKTRHPDSLPLSDLIAFERDVADPARATSGATFFCSGPYPAKIYWFSHPHNIKAGSLEMSLPLWRSVETGEIAVPVMDTLVRPPC